MSNEAMSNEAMSNEAMSNEAMSNEAMSNEALGDDGTEAVAAHSLDEDAGSEATSETVDAPPVRNPRKGRGSSAQRATP